MTNVFSDFHHIGLFYSFQLLFEKRLGWNLYSPIGTEWFEQGYWKVCEPYNNNPSTIKQFLSLEAQDYRHPDNTAPLNRIKEMKPNYYEIIDVHHETTHKAITIEQFKAMPIDIVIASLPQHIPVYKKLIMAFHPEAKLIVHMGNMFTEVMNNLHEVPNLLASTIEFKVPPSCNAVFYHQEFNLDIFKPSHQKAEKKITSFLIDLPKTGHGHLFYTMKSMMPEYEFKTYGAGCDDGVITGVQNIANIMNSSYFGFHAKWGGDGFGHLLYNWMAVGKPIITCYQDYTDKLGAELLTDDETCFDINKHGVESICEMIKNLAPERYEWMCQQCYNRFKEKVDYNLEEQKIRNFLDNLK